MDKKAVPIPLQPEPTGGVDRQARPEIILEGTGRTVLWDKHLAACDAARIGTWLGEPGKLAVTSYPNDEVFTVTSGHIRLTGDHPPLDVTPGSGAFVPKGWQGTWENVELSRKVFVILTREEV